MRRIRDILCLAVPTLLVFLHLTLPQPAFAQLEPAAQQVGSYTTVVGAEGLESRNGSIRLDGTRADGPIRTRNGSVSIGGGSEVRDISARNGRIQVAGPTVVMGSIDTRNGRIEVGERVTVSGDVESRNGRIELRDEASVDGSVRGRNGRILVGARSSVGGEIDTRNGGVVLESGARVAGTVRSRNGTVRLVDAWVGRDIDVSAGDVHLDGTSEVTGDLIVLMDRDWGRTGLLSFFRSRATHAPVVRIGPDARIRGRLIVDERARLEIDPGAEVPTAERYPSRQASGVR